MASQFLERAALSNYSANPEASNDPQIYERVRRYILTDSQLKSNAFPRTTEIPDVCKFFDQSSQRRITTRKTCRRCKQGFVLLENGEFEDMNDLCGSARWSNATKHHVHEDNLCNCNGFVQLPLTTNKTEHSGVYAIDCEMANTIVGFELTRISVVDFNCQVVYDSYVRPSGNIVDYNTEWSGIEERHLNSVTTSLQDVQEVFKQKFSSDTIFVGHSLGIDLKALKIIHSCIVDTSVLFPHKRGPPMKRALRHLVSDYLGTNIEKSGARGHSSIENASACVELLKFKMR